jgi:hypothetical protein
VDGPWLIPFRHCKTPDGNKDSNFVETLRRAECCVHVMMNSRYRTREHCRQKSSSRNDPRSQESVVRDRCAKWRRWWGDQDDGTGGVGVLDEDGGGDGGEKREEEEEEGGGAARRKRNKREVIDGGD